MRDVSRLHGASSIRPRRCANVVETVLHALAVATLFYAAPVSAQRAAPQAQPPDAEIKQAIIRESLAQYPGPCPCPYNVARNGSHCGKRSAYSKPGGYSPICYEADVTPEMVNAWRQKHRNH
jgi:hypothetical protein